MAHNKTSSDQSAPSFREKRIDVLLSMHEYNVELGRAYLEYREHITQISIYIYVAIFAIIFALKFAVISIPISILAIIFSRQMELFVLKFYERSEYHFTRSRMLRKQIDRDMGGGYKSISDIFEESLKLHQKNFVIKNRRNAAKKLLNANVHDRWASLHRLASVVGLILLAVSITNSFLCATGICVMDGLSEIDPTALLL